MTYVKNNTQALSLPAWLNARPLRLKYLVSLIFLSATYLGGCTGDQHDSDGGIAPEIALSVSAGESHQIDDAQSIKSRDKMTQDGSMPSEKELALQVKLGEARGSDKNAQAMSSQGDKGERSTTDQVKSAQGEAKEGEAKEGESKKSESKKSKSKKSKRCRRGIHKGQKKCKIERGYISLYHINRGKRHRNLHLIDDQRRIIPKSRELMLELLGDWREKTQCKRGYSFNYDYQGRASWRMYKCYVQDRLLWYLYLIGHHFDSEIHIVSGLRSKERKSSRHHNGHAVDFRVPGVKAKKVWEYAKRTFPLVGIGYYPKGQFIHLDVGRDHHQAYWVDSSGSGEAAAYKRGVSQIQRGRARKSQGGMISSIQRSLKRHHKSFKVKQGRYLKKKRVREKARKRREARRKKKRRARSKKKKKSKTKSKKRRGETKSKKPKSKSKARKRTSAAKAKTTPKKTTPRKTTPKK